MEQTKSKISAFNLCVVALAICINVIGGHIALLLHLPIYLDTIGTIMTGALLGPIYGMLPNVLSGLIMGFTGDVYSLYYAPVGIILGFVTGLVFKRRKNSVLWILWAALIITIPSTIVSASITAILFGGITSSGSTVLVQLITNTTPLGLTASCFIVQFITDYIDRLIGVLIVVQMIRILPSNIKERFF
ncbi:MAG: ECF transporter S component [Eubacterium sp.]|nr:ECF transporter S component [Eubacterium sp.]